MGRKSRWAPSYNPVDPVVRSLAAAEETEHRRNLRIGIVVALAVHAALLVVSLPEHPPALASASSKRNAYVMRTVRFQPPRASPKAKTRPKVKAKRIPIPDPTPDDPEPLLRELEEPELPEIDVEGIEGAVYIPSGGPPRPGGDAIAVGGDVSAPVKIFSPQPHYTEDARLDRIQGVVILRTVVDTKGDVIDVVVLKGLPGGLTESAIETVSTWKFEPALQDGRPVSVYFMLTISFSLQ